MMADLIKELKEKGIEVLFSEGKLIYNGPVDNINSELIEKLRINKGRLIKYFWPKDLIQFTLNDGSVVLGEWVATETIPESESADNPKGNERIQLKIGNRDLYGLDFRWVDQADIVNEQYPSDVLAFERREWGNFYGQAR